MALAVCKFYKMNNVTLYPYTNVYDLGNASMNGDVMGQGSIVAGKHARRVDSETTS